MWNNYSIGHPHVSCPPLSHFLYLVIDFLTNKTQQDYEVTAVPGTVHLVDLDGTMHAKHAKGAQKDIVLVTSPSSDPDDPMSIFESGYMYTLPTSNVKSS